MTEITEESHNSSQHSELNVSNTIETSVSAHPNGVNATATSSDVNPLLVGDDSYQVERRKRPQVVKRSPNFARSNKVHIAGTGEIAIGTTEQQNGLSMAGTPVQSSHLMRPISLQFQRSTSERDLPQCTEANSASALGHRRAHSYGAPNAYLSNPVGSLTPPVGGLFRTASATSRESYAAPIFTRQPTILMRAESQRRKNEIQQTLW